MDPVFVLLVVICVLCCAYFTVPDEHQEERVKGRDMAKEHALGAHRHTPAWGCPSCKR